MKSLFQFLLERSLDVTWLVLAVLALRFLLKRAPKWLRCWLWALVALRLLCTFSLESSLSLVPQREIIRGPVISQSQASAVDAPPVLETQIEWMPASPLPEANLSVSHNPVSSVPDSDPTLDTPDWMMLGSLIWAAGSLALAAYACVSYWRVRQKVSASISVAADVFLCDYIDTPFLLGSLRPRIYLPTSLDPEDLACVLSHERAHLARRDHWWKPLGFGLLILYWFHPLLWISYLLFCRDLELACDERVIRNLDARGKKAYSQTLLKCSVPRNTLAVCPLAFGEVGVLQRIRSIANYRKPGFWILAASVIALAAAALFFATSPKRHTLYDLMDLPVREIDEIALWSHKGRVTCSGENLQQILDLFDALEYDPEPLSQTPILEDADANHWSYWFAEIECGEEITKIYSDYDHTKVWMIQPDGTIGLPYALKEPEILQNYLSDYVTPILGRYVTREAYATAEEPGLWLKMVSPEAISAARLWTVLEDRTLDTRYLSGKNLPELVNLLNAIPETALGEMQTDPEFTYDDLRYFVTGDSWPENFRKTPGAFLLLEDEACDFTALLRSYDDKVELLLIEDFVWQTSHLFVQPGYARCWTLDSQELEAYLLNLKDYIPQIWTWVGSRHAFSREYTQISDGQTTISTYFLLDWDYEILEPGGQSFGFRCRPKDESSGWIYFEWWGHNFPASAEETENGIRGYLGGCKTVVYSLGPWDNQEYGRYSCSHGDFVVRKDQDVSWLEKYNHIVSDMETITDVHCPP